MFCSGLQLDIRAGQHGPVSSHNIASTQCVSGSFLSCMFLCTYVCNIYMCCVVSLRCTNTNCLSLALSEAAERLVLVCGVILYPCSLVEVSPETTCTKKEVACTKYGLNFVSA